MQSVLCDDASLLEVPSTVYKHRSQDALQYVAEGLWRVVLPPSVYDLGVGNLLQDWYVSADSDAQLDVVYEDHFVQPEAFDSYRC